MEKGNEDLDGFCEKICDYIIWSFSGYANSGPAVCMTDKLMTG